jgi:hypothetical protein
MTELARLTGEELAGALIEMMPFAGADEFQQLNSVSAAEIQPPSRAALGALLPVNGVN